MLVSAICIPQIIIMARSQKHNSWICPSGVWHRNPHVSTEEVGVYRSQVRLTYDSHVSEAFILCGISSRLAALSRNGNLCYL